MPLPIAHGLIGASIIAASRPNISLRQHWKALSLGAALAVAPDCDFFFEWVLNLDGVWHRGFSHSIMFSVACGLLASVLSGGFRPKEAAAYGAATLSHCLLDLVTTRKHLGVELFWPFSSARIDLDLFDYSQFNFDPRQHPVSLILRNILEISLIEAAAFIPVFALTLWLRRKAREARRGGRPSARAASSTPSPRARRGFAE